MELEDEVLKRSYGICPAQLDGITEDGRPFYFRSRGSWSLRVGKPGWIPNVCAWPTFGIVIGYGDYEIEDPDTIDELVEEYLGPWRHVTWEETLFDQECLHCKTVFRSDASNICMDCLVKKVLRLE